MDKLARVLADKLEDLSSILLLSNLHMHVHGHTHTINQTNVTIMIFR